MWKRALLLLFLSSVPVGLVQILSSVPKIETTWMELRSNGFRFIYRTEDEFFAKKLASYALWVRTVAAGFFGYISPEEPVVVVQGSKDMPPWGGFFSPMPMRISISVALQRDPRGVFLHEFLHYTQASAPWGLFYDVSNVFGKDVRSANLVLGLHSLEGTTSYLDGNRSSVWNEMYYKAAILEDRMWSWAEAAHANLKGSAAIRPYLSHMLFVDYVETTFGLGSFSRLWKYQVEHPLMNEDHAIRQVFQIDPELLWSQIVQHARERFSEKYRPNNALIMGTRDSGMQEQWLEPRATDRGIFFRMARLDQATTFAFLNQDGVVEQIEGIGGQIQAWSVDQAGSKVLISRTEPSVSGLEIEYQKADLMLYTLNSKNTVVDVKRLGLARGLLNPALSPDGKRAFAVQRKSDNWGMVEIDLNSGGISPMDGLPSVTKIVFSPDGGTLGLVLNEAGNSDIALFDLTSGRLKQITHDQAFEFAPIFDKNGNFYFSSDREDEIAIYMFTEKGIVRFLLDPVGAWNPIFLDESVIYSTWTADGLRLKQVALSDLNLESVPGFSKIKPSYLTKQEIIWKSYFERGELVVAGYDFPIESSVRELIDVPWPSVWYPLPSYTNAGFGIGFATQGASAIGHTQSTFGALFLPEHNQLEVHGGLAISFVGLRLVLNFGQSYYPSQRFQVESNEEPELTWNSRRFASLAANFPIITDSSSTGQLTKLQGDILLVSNWTGKRGQSFNFVDGLEIQPETSFDWNAALTLNHKAPRAILDVFDSEGLVLKVGVSGSTLATDLSSVMVSGLDFRLASDLGSAILGLNLGASWSPSSIAASWFRPLNDLWATSEYEGFVRAELRFMGKGAMIDDRLLSIPFDRTAAYISLSSGIGFADWQAEWVGYIDTELAFLTMARYFYSELPLEFHVGFRFRPDVLINKPLSINDFYFGLRIYGQTIFGDRAGISQ